MSWWFGKPVHVLTCFEIFPQQHVWTQRRWMSSTVCPRGRENAQIDSMGWLLETNCYPHQVRSGWHISVCFGPAGLHPGLEWPLFSTLLERQSRGHKSGMRRVLSRMLHLVLASWIDAQMWEPLSQLMLTLLAVSFSLNAAGWVRLWERSLQSLCDSTAQSRMCEPDDKKR